MEPRSVSLELAAHSDSHGSWRSFLQLILAHYNEKSESHLPAEPGRSTGESSLPQRWTEHQILSLGPWEGEEKQNGDPQQRSWGAGDCKCSPPHCSCVCPGGLHVAGVRAFFKLTFWLASSCSEPCFRKYLAIT